ncbi:50S ribosomal protein L25 [Candidatus Gottesmanbacteria bacterium]|nr:50S ribosomal protein L25 [Candidatus Gottesmanbacteria bacterium]
MSIPANIYGKKVSSLAIEVTEKDFSRAFAKVHETGLVELTVGSEKRPVLIHNVQYNPVTNSPLHVDFFQVDLKEKVAAKVPVELLGSSPAVKDKVGVLLTLLGEIEVEALPADLPEKITVDVSRLSKVDDVIKVSDLSIPSKVKVLTDSASEIVKVAPLVSKEAEALAKEEAEKAAAAAAAAAAEAPSVEAPPAPGESPAPAEKPAGEAPKKE